MLITLQHIKYTFSSPERWETLFEYVGSPTDLSIQISLGDVLLSNGIDDALLCAKFLSLRDRITLVMRAVKMAATFTDDKRVNRCVGAITRWHHGDDSFDLNFVRRVAEGIVSDARNVQIYSRFGKNSILTIAFSCVSALATAYVVDALYSSFVIAFAACLAVFAAGGIIACMLSLRYSRANFWIAVAGSIVLHSADANVEKTFAAVADAAYFTADENAAFAARAAERERQKADILALSPPTVIKGRITTSC